ncbi:MAG TPA: TonB-dependent receptor [Steroidobacteraceae bacterium]|nr:TonB-dependent receptor [Steroidobacteraceae bacterium]
MSRIHLAGAALALAVVSFHSPVHAQQATDASQLEEVVVTASPIGDPDHLATIAGSVNRDQLLRSGGNTLADALDQVPGVTSSGFAAGAGRPVIRGMDANRVRVLEDGVGSFDVSDVGPDHGVPIDPFTAERVEVVRGAATLRYGSQAIGGVVNAISDRVPTHLPDGTSSGEVVAEFGSVADSRDFAGQYNLRQGGFALHADAFDRHSGDYDTPDGTQDNSWLHAHGGALGGAWIDGDNNLGLDVEQHDSRYGIPSDTTFIDMQQTRLGLRSGWQLAAGPWQKLTVDGGWANYKHSEIENDSGEVDSTFKDREWDSRAEAVGGDWGVFSATSLGMELQQRDFSALGEGEDYLLPTTTKNRAVFGFAEAPLAKALRLQFGARVENVQVDGTTGEDVAVSRSFTPLSGSAGLVYDLTDTWRAGLALTSAARAPAQTELFAHGPHDGPATYETGDATLGLERANSLEATLRFRGERVHADGSVWATNFSNFIYGALTGRHCDDDGSCSFGGDEELKELFYRQQDARFRGAEGHAQFELLQQGSAHLHLDLLADTVRAKLAGGAGNVPRIPPYHVGGGLSWQGPRVDASVTVKYAGRQDKLATAETETGGYTDVGAQLAVRPWARHSGVEFALIGRNLTNSAQRDAVALNKDEVLMPGRDIRLMIRAALD